MKTLGPCSTLPGARFSVKDGEMCDEHPERPAVTLIQGETDSFGAECHHCCQECTDGYGDSTMDGNCDWCGKDTKLMPTRDSDEGLAGQVYWVCVGCKKSYIARMEAEADYDINNCYTDDMY